MRRRGALNDTSFDLILVTDVDYPKIQIEFHKFQGCIPEYSSYCGDVIQKAVHQLPYAKDHHIPRGFKCFPHAIKLRTIKF